MKKIKKIIQVIIIMVLFCYPVLIADHYEGTPLGEIQQFDGTGNAPYV